MITAIVRTALVALRRDRASLALSFVLPIAFFSIFAFIFGSQRASTPRVTAVVVDQDQSSGSRQLVSALKREGSLDILAAHSSGGKAAAPYTAASAEAAVRAGDAPVALIIPKGYGAHPISFGPDSAAVRIQMLYDSSDAIAPQVVNGLLQKVAMTAMPVSMAQQGLDYSSRWIGGYTPEQQRRINQDMAQLRAEAAHPDASAAGDHPSSGIIQVEQRAVTGQSNNKQIISFYAAGIGVMFLLFTASGSAGALLDEAESGALDRVLSTRVTMGTLLAGKLVFNTGLAFVQLVAMFLWGWAFFRLDLFSHIPGFVIMGLASAVAVAAFGLLLAALCHTRAQLGAVSTLLILMMSAIGGSMFPRYLMPASVQKAGLFTINAWAIDGFTKVFWRDLPLTALWPQVSVLLAVAVVLFLLARRVARRWEYA